MKASKENAREAMTKLEAMKLLLKREGSIDFSNTVDFLREFLEAAERKLPREESFARDMRREAGGK